MSFAKAKIQRFNEFRECTPSPAKYNVALRDKVKFGIIPQSERFTKTGSPTGSECGSVQSTPCFQTPTVPKSRRMLPMSLTKTHQAHHGVDPDELKERMVELQNKNDYIAELTEQIEELKAKMSTIIQDKAKIAEDKSKLLRELELTRSEQSEVIKNLNLTYARELAKAQEDFGDIYSEIASIRKASQQLKDENLVEMSKLLENLSKFEQLYRDSVEAQKHVLEVKENEMKRLVEERDAQVESIKNALAKEKECELRRSREVIGSKLAEIELLKEKLREMDTFNEIQTQQKIEEVEGAWKLKLECQIRESEAILKECQDISEYIIKQCEIEKNQSLAKKDEEYKELLEKQLALQDNYNALQLEYGKVQTDLIDALEDLTRTQQTVTVLSKEKRTYDITITTSLETIEVLKRRLINSDRDVEQLKEELMTVERRIIDEENKNVELRNQLNDAQSTNEELEMQFESSLKLINKDIQQVKQNLLDKVEALGGSLKMQVAQTAEDKEKFDEVYAQLHDQQKVNSQAQSLIRELNRVLDSLILDNSEMESKYVEMEAKLQEYKSEVEEAAEIRKKYIEKSGKYDALSQEFEQLLNQFDEVKKQNLEMASRQCSMDEQLEFYQDEVDLLKGEKAEIEAEAEELRLKYADAIGHNNHKQKIKHLNDLTKKTSELFQHNCDLTHTINDQNKQLEKLRRELAELKKTKKVKTHDKENLASPRPLNRVESPGPLREKN